MTINSIRIGQSRYRQFRSFCSARYDSATEALAIHGDGHRIPNQSDAFQYVYKPLSGEGEKGTPPPFCAKHQERSN